MQLDDRSFPSFCAAQAWQDPAKNIDFAAKLLASLFERFSDAWFPEALAVAAYNAGGGAVRRVANRLAESATMTEIVSALDAITTGKDYVSDVLCRREEFMR
jgi:soluble lytic murein transglycosylase-like protein